MGRAAGSGAGRPGATDDPARPGLAASPARPSAGPRPSPRHRGGMRGAGPPGPRWRWPSGLVGPGPSVSTLFGPALGAEPPPSGPTGQRGGWSLGRCPYTSSEASRHGPVACRKSGEGLGGYCRRGLRPPAARPRWTVTSALPRRCPLAPALARGRAGVGTVGAALVRRRSGEAPQRPRQTHGWTRIARRGASPAPRRRHGGVRRASATRPCRVPPWMGSLGAPAARWAPRGALPAEAGTRVAAETARTAWAPTRPAWPGLGGAVEAGPLSGRPRPTPLAATPLGHR